MGRHKWFKKKPNLRIDNVVLISDDLATRSQWRIGQIIATHPDAYGVVCTVSTKSSTMELCRLAFLNWGKFSPGVNFLILGVNEQPILILC